MSDRIGDSTAPQDRASQQAQPPSASIKPHALSFIELAVKSTVYAKSFIPSLYLSGAAVDSAKPLGRGGSFIVTLRKLPKLRPTTYIRRAYVADETYHPKPKEIPEYVVYKTANIEFEESGFAMPKYEARFKSVLL